MPFHQPNPIDSISRRRWQERISETVNAEQTKWENLDAERIARCHARTDDIRNICCIQSNVPITDNELPDEIVYLPFGYTTINAGQVGGGSYAGGVDVDSSTWRSIDCDFQQMQRDGRKVWIDFDHNGGESAGEIVEFQWDRSRGVVAKVVWSKAGADALRNREYFSFSPSFKLSTTTGRVTGLITDGSSAAGALVNLPAFRDRMPNIV